MNRKNKIQYTLYFIAYRYNTPSNKLYLTFKVQTILKLYRMNKINTILLLQVNDLPVEAFNIKKKKNLTLEIPINKNKL